MTKFKNVNEAVSAINAESAVAVNRWAKRCEAVDQARVSVGTAPMDPWTRTVLSTVLETYTKRVALIDERNRQGLGRALESTQTADVSFLRTHGINILTATMPNLIANELLSVQPLN